MKAEGYERRRLELAGWPIEIESYKLGDVYLLHDQQRRPRRALRARRGPDARGSRAAGVGESRALPRANEETSHQLDHAAIASRIRWPQSHRVTEIKNAR